MRAPLRKARAGAQAQLGTQTTVTRLQDGPEREAENVGTGHAHRRHS
jgi:hypothetical protein